MQRTDLSFNELKQHLCTPRNAKTYVGHCGLVTSAHSGQAWTDPSRSLELKADRQVYGCFLQSLKELAFKLPLDSLLLLVAPFPCKPTFHLHTVACLLVSSENCIDEEGKVWMERKTRARTGLGGRLQPAPCGKSTCSF